MLEAKLENYLWQHIPISSAMGIRVDFASPSKVILEAPFDKNINHKKTVFGGSLHAVATLACWSLLHINLANFQGTQIVIASSEVKYLAPVNADFKAQSGMSDPSEWERFVKILEKMGKARIKLSAKIFHEERLCVDYSGVFVVMREKL